MLFEAMSSFVLEIVEGPDAGQAFQLGSAVEVGREGGVGVMLTNDELVSRRHARLSPRSDGVVLEDLASRNGTFVNGTEIYSPVLVTPGDEITIGVSVLHVRASTQAPEGARRVPEALTSARPVPLAVPGPGLAAEQRPPDYLSPDGGPGSAPASEAPPIHRLLDVHTKHMARTAPLAIFVLVVIVVIIALALR